MKVLVLEDDSGVAELVKHYLETADFHAVLSSNVSEAWRKVVSEGPQAAVVDLKLNGESGWSLIEKLRSDGRFSNMPLIVLTGLHGADVLERSNELACDYLAKPFSGSALIDKLRLRINEAGNSRRV